MYHFTDCIPFASVSKTIVRCSVTFLGKELYHMRFLKIFEKGFQSSHSVEHLLLPASEGVIHGLQCLTVVHIPLNLMKKYTYLLAELRHLKENFPRSLQ